MSKEVLKINFKDYRKYIIIGLILLILYISFLVVKPIISPILTGAVLAYIFYPAYKWIYKKVKIKCCAAAIVSVIVILLIIIPGFFLLNSLTKEVYTAYILAKQRIGTGIITGCADKENALCEITNAFKEFTSDNRFQFYFSQGMEKMTSSLTERITNFIFTIPKRLLEVFITFFVMYYLFKDGKELVERLKYLIPLGEKHQNLIIGQSKRIAYGVVYGTIIVVLVQGALAAFGFFIFGIPTPIIWGILTAFCALIPFIGTAFIWLPASLILIAQGYLEGEPFMILKGFGLMIYGALIIASIDNIIKPKIISKRTQTHPIIILMGVLGGLALLGVVGALIGPLLLSLLIKTAELYKNGSL
jgi:predicted PurR-regulated permease PerM